MRTRKKAMKIVKFYVTYKSLQCHSLILEEILKDGKTFFLEFSVIEWLLCDWWNTDSFVNLLNFECPCTQVTKRVADGGNDYGGWENWNWRSSGDMFLNGAFFTDSGSSNIDSSLYQKATSFTAKPSSSVGTLTANAGPFQCGLGVLSQTRSQPPPTFNNYAFWASFLHFILWICFPTHAWPWIFVGACSVEARS